MDALNVNLEKLNRSMSFSDKLSQCASLVPHFI